MSGSDAGWSRLASHRDCLERPEHGDQEGGYQPEDDGKGEAGTEEVA